VLDFNRKERIEHKEAKKSKGRTAESFKLFLFVIFEFFVVKKVF